MQSQSAAKASPSLQLEGPVHRNLSTPALITKALERKEGRLTIDGAFASTTGKYTGRSPKDKFLAKESSTQDTIDWGAVNQPIEPETFEHLFERVQDYLRQREVFIFDGFAGADPDHRMPIRVINELAWHNLFARQLFVRPTAAELAEHEPQFTVISAPGFQADPKRDKTRSETFIAVSFEERIILIGGTEYAGEMKKGDLQCYELLASRQRDPSNALFRQYGERRRCCSFLWTIRNRKNNLVCRPRTPINR